MTPARGCCCGVPISVHFSVGSDDHATRVAGLLEAMGYSPTRHMENGNGLLDWAIHRLVLGYKLNEGEARILWPLLVDQADAPAIAKSLGLSVATIEWRVYSIFSKTSVGDREQLLRLVLGLPVINRLVDVEPPATPAG
jgi:DNA-binding CsgD family transcriptional regulator